MDARTTSSSDALRIGPWRFDPLSNQLTDDKGQHRQLEDRASRVLALLVQRRGEVVSREELVTSIWDGRTLSDNSVAVVISDLRKTLGDDAKQGRFIQTVPKRGYRLTADSSPADTAGEAAVGATGSRRTAITPSLIAALLALALVSVLVWRSFSGAPVADPQAVVVTINNVQNQTGDTAYDAMADSITELGLAHLSDSVGTAALVRDRWDFDAADPSRGLYEDFGADARVYHIATRIVIDGGSPVITMVANDPKTSQVFWASTFPVPAGPLAPSLEAHLDDFLDKVLQPSG